MPATETISRFSSKALRIDLFSAYALYLSVIQTDANMFLVAIFLILYFSINSGSSAFTYPTLHLLLLTKLSIFVVPVVSAKHMASCIAKNDFPMAPVLRRNPTVQDIKPRIIYSISGRSLLTTSEINILSIL